MNNKSKNIISNILGLVIVAFGAYKYYGDSNVTNFLIVAVLGLALFLFKASESRNWVKKVLGKKVDGNLAPEAGIGGELPKEDDEEVPA